MNLFDTVKKKVRGWMQKTGASTGLAREFKDVFELGGVPAFNQFYYFGIFIWKWIYKGMYKAWHIVPDFSPLHPNGQRELYRLDTAKAVCSELAGLIWAEQCEVHVSRDGAVPEDGQTDPLDAFVSDVLRRNGFTEKMQSFVEQGLALGGGAIKPYVDGRMAEGGIVSGTEVIRLSYCMADQFVPIAWDNAEVREGVFISRLARGGYYYTRLEWHRWDGATYVIDNELYRADKGGPAESQDILGIRYPLQEIYPNLQEHVELPGIRHPLFSYFRTATANNIDDNSPLGMSVYGNSLSVLHAIDIVFDSFVNEFILGRKRIIVPSSYLDVVVDRETGQLIRRFDPHHCVFEALNIDPDSGDIPTDSTQTLRVTDHREGLNILFSVLCLQMGFSPGTFTFDQAGGVKTATEVISENSKTYKTIKGNQAQLKTAIQRAIDGIIELAVLYDMRTAEGVPVASLVQGGYHVNVVFDDSILQDRQTNLNEGILLVTNGLMSKLTYMTSILGMTREEALAEIDAIRRENGVSGTALDEMLLGGAE